MHKPKRRRRAINYARLNEGIIEISQTHPHVEFFTKHIQHSKDSEHLRPVTQSAINQFFETTSEPVFIPRAHFDLLEMKVDPLHFTPRAIASHLGDSCPVPVMDSVTQQPVKGWNLGKWRDYFEMSTADRSKITDHGTLNLITLEFSGSSLEKHVTRPAKVTQFDLVEELWSQENPPPGPKPKVQLYSLTGAANSFTDFHIDFAGSSVYYHIISGAKSFIFVPPTPPNLKAYEKWCMSSDQSTTWFPTVAKGPAFQLDLGPGDSMLIPSGWIHAVYTPVDTCVIGGNFVTKKDMPMQKTIADLERRTAVPKKFQFPQFDKIVAFAQTIQ